MCKTWHVRYSAYCLYNLYMVYKAFVIYCQKGHRSKDGGLLLVTGQLALLSINNNAEFFFMGGEVYDL